MYTTVVGTSWYPYFGIKSIRKFDVHLQILNTYELCVIWDIVVPVFRNKINS